MEKLYKSTRLSHKENLSSEKCSVLYLIVLIISNHLPRSPVREKQLNRNRFPDVEEKSHRSRDNGTLNNCVLPNILGDFLPFLVIYLSWEIINDVSLESYL